MHIIIRSDKKRTLLRAKSSFGGSFFSCAFRVHMCAFLLIFKDYFIIEKIQKVNKENQQPCGFEMFFRVIAD